MQLRIFSVLGEALNFGARRMATIMRVAWLPIVLLMILNMAAVYGALSVIAGRAITFADVGAILSAEQLLARYLARGLNTNPEMMAAIFGGSFILQYILIASFMAPLIRLSGLGEKPAPGLVRLPFGPDQLRYIISSLFSLLFMYVLILAPIAVTSFFVLKYIVEAMSATMASFPDPNSLHTIELITAGEGLAQRGAEWVFGLAVPLAVAAPLALVVWFVAFMHFHPRNRPNAPERGNALLRAIVAFIVVAVFAGAAFWLLREPVMQYLKAASTLGSDAVPDFTNTPVNVILFFTVAGYMLVGYFSLRLYPYPGVAVCRHSLGLGGTLRLSRGWNIIRLQLILVAMTVLFTILIVIINVGFLQIVIPSVINTLYQAAAVSTRLVNSGVTGEWVQPLFVWVWTAIRMLVTIFWSFFYYGVLAGLYGRLYRESEREIAAG